METYNLKSLALSLFNSSEGIAFLLKREFMLSDEEAKFVIEKMNKILKRFKEGKRVRLPKKTMLWILYHVKNCGLIGKNAVEAICKLLDDYRKKGTLTLISCPGLIFLTNKEVREGVVKDVVENFYEVYRGEEIIYETSTEKIKRILKKYDLNVGIKVPPIILEEILDDIDKKYGYEHIEKVNRRGTTIYRFKKK